MSLSNEGSFESDVVSIVKQGVNWRAKVGLFHGLVLGYGTRSNWTNVQLMSIDEDGWA